MVCVSWSCVSISTRSPKRPYMTWKRATRFEIRGANANTPGLQCPIKRLEKLVVLEGFGHGSQLLAELYGTEMIFKLTPPFEWRALFKGTKKSRELRNQQRDA